MAIATVSNVRLIADITTDDISDADLENIILAATAKFNHEINSRIEKERIGYIDAWHKNVIDGSNDTFYLAYPQFGLFVGDSNDSGDITVDDVVIEEWKNDGTITVKTVNSLDCDTGKFVLAEAPKSSSKLYANYQYCPVDVSAPDAAAKQAVANLAAALSMTKLEARQFKKVSLRVLNMTKQPVGFEKHFNQYKKYIQEIKRKMARLARYGPRPDPIKPIREIK